MLIRVLPVIEIADCSVSQIIEGASSTVYSRYTRQHPDTARRSQCFPHPDHESEETIQKWLSQWEKARFDIFALKSMYASVGAFYLLQRQNDDGTWSTLPLTNGTAEVSDAPFFMVPAIPSSAVKSKSETAGSYPAEAGATPATATTIIFDAPRKRGRPRKYPIPA